MLENKKKQPLQRCVETGKKCVLKLRLFFFDDFSVLEVNVRFAKKTSFPEGTPTCPNMRVLHIFCQGFCT